MWNVAVSKSQDSIKSVRKFRCVKFVLFPFTRISNLHLLITAALSRNVRVRNPYLMFVDHLRWEVIGLSGLSKIVSPSVSELNV